MTTWAVIASGESATPEVVSRVRDLPCVAVNNAFLLAPWARAVVAGDAVWWREHPEARSLDCDLWCSSEIRDTNWLRKERGLTTSTNSGLRGLDVAIHVYGARRVLLIGVDMVGKHFHPDHPSPMKNPNDRRFGLFRQQFDKYAAAQIPSDVEVLNCSPVSRLECFRKASIDEALCYPA